jgi:hypothetical protein
MCEISRPMISANPTASTPPPPLPNKIGGGYAAFVVRTGVRGWTGRRPGDLLGGAWLQAEARRLVGGGLCSMVGAGYAAAVEQNQGLSSAPDLGVARLASHGGGRACLLRGLGWPVF